MSNSLHLSQCYLQLRHGHATRFPCSPQRPAAWPAPPRLNAHHESVADACACAHEVDDGPVVCRPHAGHQHRIAGSCPRLRETEATASSGLKPCPSTVDSRSTALARRPGRARASGCGQTRRQDARVLEDRGKAMRLAMTDPWITQRLHVVYPPLLLRRLPACQACLSCPCLAGRPCIARRS